MSGGAKKLLHAAAGTAAAGGATYVEDVFATHLYTGNNANNHEINNGVDLSDGGLVWFKKRNTTGDHWLVDSERGGTLALRSNSNVANYSQTGAYSFIQSFDDDGFTMGDQGDINNSSDFASWSFRKQPGFFDVVKFSTTSSGGTQAISHNLGSIPGYIVIKKTSVAQSWFTWHKGVTSPNSNWWRNYAGWEANAQFYDFGDDSGINSAPTATTVTLGTYFTNVTADYVAYFFAEGGSDDQIFGDDGDEAIIKTGSFQGSGGGSDVNLGFEPQWVLVKSTSIASSWHLFDTMRGMPADVSGKDAQLFPDTTAAENTSYADQINPNATGFHASNSWWGTNKFVYIAIRRGPMKEPDAGTDVYIADESHASAYENPMFQSTFPVDMAIYFDKATTAGPYFGTRLTGKTNIQTDSSSSGDSETNHVWDYMNGFYDRGSGSDDNNICHMFRRYPKVFDVVTYIGNNNNSPLRVINHNLNAVPELVIIKNYTNSLHWSVGTKTGVSAVDDYNVYLNLNGVYSGASAITATATTLTLTQFGGTSQINAANAKHVVLFFATLAGVSKVGTYTGTGSSLNVDCGMSGVRYLLIKRTGANGVTGHWHVFDSTVQGIVAGYDPFTLLSQHDAMTTNIDVIDQHASGFTVTANYSALNTDGAVYLFLAIA